MFPRTYYPARYFAPRYWPCPSQAPPHCVIVLITISSLANDVITMNDSANALTLSQAPAPELTLSASTAESLKLEVPQVNVLLESSNTIYVHMTQI